MAQIKISLTSNKVLSQIPEGLRDPLIDSYNNVIKNYVEHRWEPAELNGGKFSEVVYCILQGHVDGAFSPKPSKPKNMLAACLNFERADATKFSRSIRIQIPRVLIGLYEIRNNRNVGHTGGDVDPNHMDSVYVVQACKWILAELIRVFHAVAIEEASAVVDALTERTSSLVWDVGTVRRVLNTELSMLNQTLIILHSYAKPMNEKELCACVEHSNPAVYRRDVLMAAHKRRLLEYSRTDGIIMLSPLGVAAAENILHKLVPGTDSNP